MKSAAETTSIRRANKMLSGAEGAQGSRLIQREGEEGGLTQDDGFWVIVPIDSLDVGRYSVEGSEARRWTMVGEALLRLARMTTS